MDHGKHKSPHTTGPDDRAGGAVIDLPISFAILSIFRQGAPHTPRAHVPRACVTHCSSKLARVTRSTDEPLQTSSTGAARIAVIGHHGRSSSHICGRSLGRGEFRECFWFCGAAQPIQTALCRLWMQQQQRRIRRSPLFLRFMLRKRVQHHKHSRQKTETSVSKTGTPYCNLQTTCGGCTAKAARIISAFI